jgi:hypothetical protein
MLTETNPISQIRSLQLERVDNWHARWGEVLDAITFLGQRDALNIDGDGWLSARQNLIVAFAGESVAGHLCFRVEPSCTAGERVVEARLEAIGVQPEFERDEIEPVLRAAAEKRARGLRCVRWVE